MTISTRFLLPKLNQSRQFTIRILTRRFYHSILFNEKKDSSTEHIRVSRYTEAHKNLDGPGDGRPTAMQIVQDKQLEGALKHKVILMTGASAGIGIETARALAATSARCFLGV